MELIEFAELTSDRRGQLEGEEQDPFEVGDLTLREVRVEQPGGYRVMPQRMMWRALRPGSQWPAGPVVVHSLPF